MSVPRKTLSTGRCVVPNCNSDIKKITTHRFPANEAWALEWKRVVNNPELENFTLKELNKKYTVCRLHFTDDCYLKQTQKPMRKPETIPSLLLPPETISDNNVSVPNIESSLSNGESTSSPTNIIPVSEPKCLMEIVSRKTKSLEPSASCQTSETLQASTEILQTPARTLKRSRLVRSAAQLSPKARQLYRGMQDARKKCQQYERKLSHAQQQRVESTNPESHEITRSMLTSQQQQFFDIATRDFGKSASGRRYTAEEKALALGLWKISPSAYRHLRTIFPLPSVTTLRKTLSNVDIDTGLNGLILQSLKETVDAIKDPRDKFVYLCWDEMSLAPHLQYDMKTDKIVGFEDWGTRRTPIFSNHVLVFMVSGVKNKWLLPLSFNFCSAATKSNQLIPLITAHVEALKKVGLTVIATVCDQGAPNVAAIKSLMQRAREQSLKRNEECERNIMLIADTRVVPLYDPPHLLKCLRNNLITKHLEFKLNGVGQTFLAKWSHVKLLFNLDSRQEEAYRGTSKLTADHVEPKGSAKMKVKYAAQVFSKSVSSAMHLLASCGPETTDTTNAMPREAKDTSRLLNFGNSLFDSVNGEHGKKNSTVLRSAVSSYSTHMNFWINAIKTIRTMKYIDVKSMKPARLNTPCLRNWILTIEGFKKIWEHLEIDEFDSFSPRYVSQDCLENFFGCLRDQGHQDKNPSSWQVTGAYKALLIQNLHSRHSLKANCENDNGSMLLNLTRALDNRDALRNDVADHPIIQDDFPLPSEEGSFAGNKKPEGTILTDVRERAAFRVATAILKSVDHCQQCQASIFHCEPQQDCNSNILESATNNILCSRYANSFKRCSELLKATLPRISYQRKLVSKLTQYLAEDEPVQWMQCPQHMSAVKALFYKRIITWYVNCFCTSINRILKGQEITFSNHSNCMVKQARAYRAKHCK